MEKKRIPYIKCNPKMWEYIKPYLDKWGYNTTNVCKPWTRSPMLVIDSCEQFGNCENFRNTSLCDYRYLVTDVEEFLERAANLKGYNYKKRNIMKINGIEIKPGMVITTSKGTNYIAFPIKTGIAFVNSNRGGWVDMPNDIISIRDLAEDYWIKSGDILWEKPKEVVITMDEIAKKFNCPVENIRIKD